VGIAHHPPSTIHHSQIYQSIPSLKREQLSPSGGGVVGEIGKFDQSEQLFLEQITLDR
jgi:hypothetical protein